MNKRTRVGRATLAAGFATVLVASLNVAPAYAATGAPTLAPRNASDPHVDYCSVTEGGVDKLYICVYTSSDLGRGGQNLYPMKDTYVYTLDTAVGSDASTWLNPGNPTSWVDRSVNTGPAFKEWQIPWALANSPNPPANPEHLWAPTSHHGPIGPPDGTSQAAATKQYLYVPDVGTEVVSGVSGDGRVSHIAVASVDKNMPWGPFTYEGRITYKGDALNNLYMSDPAIVTTSFNHPGQARNGETSDYLQSRAGGPATWLLWANGDWNNGGSGCGDLSIGLLNDVSMTELIDNPDESVSRIQINGIDALGTCSGANHPYIEGPELYDLTQVGLPLPGCDAIGQNCHRYMLFFSAKPAGSENQVLAYATASNIYGPYTYRDKIMAGTNTSWTNHGSIYADTRGVVHNTNNPFGIRFLLFFHDDTGGTDHHRKMYAQCLTYSLEERRFLTATRPPGPQAPNLNQCSGTTA